MALSFSAAAKAEICKFQPHKNCCALAQCFGILLYSNSFGPDGIKIITESREFAWMLPRLFRKAFDIGFDSFPSMEAPGKLVFQIWDEEKIEAIMDAFGWGGTILSWCGIMLVGVASTLFATTKKEND
jgi:hypothetical protein